MTTSTYEFTAFSKSDLTSEWIRNGSKITIPNSDPVCISVSDDDTFLSGDGRYRRYNDEQALDHSGQEAKIIIDGQEAGNNNPIYAENFFFLKDQSNNIYKMIKIEQEGSNKSYFTFVNDGRYKIPSEGAELIVVSSRDVRGNSVDYKDLGVGEKAESSTGAISGRVFNDENKDGIDNSDDGLGSNLITNGDFEDHPSLRNGSWGFFDEIEGWVATRDKIEIQEGRVSGTQNTAGNAVVEMDAYANATLQQNVNIVEEGTYQFSLDYAMRGNNVDTNGVAVYVDGKLQATVHPDSNNFETLTFEVDLDVGNARIELKGLGKSDGLGTIIDNVKLQKQIGSGEEGLEGVTVYLLDKHGGEVLGNNGQPITTVTDANGEYSFEGVATGNYRVKFEAPSGKTATKQNVGNDDRIDSDINSRGVSDVVTVKPGKETADVDAGYIGSDICVRVTEGDTSFKVDFDSHKNIVTEDVWFAQKNIDPGSAKIVGSGNITEGSRKSYKLQLDEVVDKDTYITLTIKDGTAKQAGSSVEEFTVYYGSNGGRNTGTVQGETVQYYTVNQHHQNQVERIWYNDPIYKHGQIGNADDNYVGVHNLVNDYKVIDSNGREVAGTTFTVKVPAGSSMSENFQVVANKEVNVGQNKFGLFATEATENFSLEVTKIGDRTDVDGQKTINITDVAANVSPIAFDLNANGKIDVTGDSTAKDHIFKQGARTVEFDLDNDGKVETIEWLKGNGDGFLVDTNKIGFNNQIDGGALFGDEGGRYANGYEKLALHDTNRDGLLTGGELNKLAIWVDDGDAILETGELRQLSEFGITTLSTHGQNVNVDGEQLLRSETRIDAESTDMVKYSITGADAQYFQIDAKTGEVTYADGFVPDYENPLDEDGDNVYNIKVIRTGNDLEEPEIEHLCIEVENNNEPGSICGRLFLDSNADGLDIAEGGVKGVKVYLLDKNGAAVLDKNGHPITTVTDANGEYVFDNIVAGEYRVRFDTPERKVFTAQNVGNDDTIDSDVNAQGLSDIVIVKEDLHLINVDAGVKSEPVGSISGRAFFDKNSDGIDNSESGLKNVKVTLLDREGHKVLDDNGRPITTSTNAQGEYFFSDVPAGQYRVKFETPEGKEITEQNVGNNNRIDSDINEQGISDLVTVKTGKATTDVDAGYIEPTGSISGRAFFDKNNDGIDNTEGGLKGVTVTLLDKNGHEILGNNGQPITTTTNAQGEYAFNNVPVGQYRINFETPEGKEITEQNVGNNDRIDSDINGQGISDIVTVKIGVATKDVDAGYVESAGSISGKAFFDKNNDGIDNAEGGLKGVTVTLLDKHGHEVLDDNGQAVTTLTNAQGKYSFTDIPVGQYRVKFDTPADKAVTEQNVGNNDRIDSDINQQGISDIVTVRADKATTDVDAGYIDSHTCVSILEGDPNLRVDFDSHKNIVTEDVWFAQKTLVPGPDSAKIVGSNKITESNTKSYKLQLDEVVTEDTFVTINIKDGTAKQAGPSVREFTANYTTSNDPEKGVVLGETVQYYTINQDHQDKVEAAWYNDPIYKQGQDGNADDNYVGVHNLVNDYKVIDSDGQEVNATSFTVKVPAGSSVSESFQIVANKEVNVGKHVFNLFDTESTEHFSLEVAKIGDRTDVDGQKTIHITDVPANVSPIAFDLNANGKIDVTGSSTSKDHAFTVGAKTVRFDLDNDGKAETIEWLKGSGDGFLVDTSKIGPNNQIDGGALFGDEGGRYANGYEKLSQHDSNNDGVLTANELNKLAIWVDDGDAVLENGELRQLSEFGMTELSTQGKNVHIGGEKLLRSETRVDAESVDMVRYSISGVDAQYFQIDPKTGEVTYADGFVPDYENPLDEGADNVYDIKIIRTGDGLEEPTVEHLCVKIEDRIEGVVTANNDRAETCYDDAVVVDVLANDSGAITVTEVNGQPITGGGAPINIGGVLVSLVDGKLVFDGSSTYADLTIGETEVDTFTYTVSGSNGGEATANVEVTFKGATDTLEKVEPLISDSEIGLRVISDDIDAGNGVGNGAFSAKLSDAGNNLNGLYDKAYCLDVFDPVQPGGFGTNIDEASFTSATVTIATTDFLTQQQQSFLETQGINGKSAAENLDLINWIINQDFENTDNGDGNNLTYTGAEVQGAIWALTNGEALEGFGEPNGIFVDQRFGTDENAQEIVDQALLQGEGFEAGEGDLVGIYVEPVGSPDFTQPFILGVDLYEECIC